MVKRTLILLAAIGCGSGSDEPRQVPSDAVLCQVWEGNGLKMQSQMGVPGYGSLSTDVIAAWGEPSERNGNVWTYEWTGGKSATLTFEQHSLCLDSKPINGLWLADIEATGIAQESCWNYERREDEATCDGCFDQGEVGECLD